MAYTLNQPIPIKGLDTSGPGTLIDRRATPNCQNVIIDRAEIKKRVGKSLVGGQATGAIMCLAEYERGTGKWFLRIMPTRIEYLDNSVAIWRDISGGGLAGSASYPIDYTTTQIAGQNVFVFTNYLEAPYKWLASGNVAALGGSPPRCKYMIQYKGYLVLAYINYSGIVYPHKVQWSDTDDPEDWTTDNAGSDILDDDKGEITGLQQLENLLVVCKNECIYNGYLTGASPVIKFDMTETKLGFIVGQTVKEIPGSKLVGLSKYGLVEYNGLRGQIVASGVMDDIIRDISAQYVYRSFAVVKNELREYHLFIPTGDYTYPYLVYKYNYLTGQVHKDTVENISAIGQRVQLTRQTWNSITSSWNLTPGIWNHVIRNSLYPKPIYGDADGYCYQENTGSYNDNGVAVDAFWDSADLIGYEPDKDTPRHSHWVEIDADLYGDKVDIFYSQDEGNKYRFLKTLYLQSRVKNYRFKIDKVSEKLRVRFRNNHSNSFFALRGFNAWYFPRENLR